MRVDAVRETLARPVYFVKYYDKGSTVLGGEQISAALRALGVESRTIYPNEIAPLRGAILVFVKTSRWWHLWEARRHGNAVVLDVQDTICFKRRIKNAHLLDGLIFKNRRALEDFATGRAHSAVIYHQWDPRHGPHRAGLDDLAPAYLGHPRSLPRSGALPGVTVINEESLRAAGRYEDFFIEGRRFNCHVSIREPIREFLYKPNTKVSTAAACHANLVTTPDESSIELLGPDYPFYTDVDESSICRTLRLARESIGGALWQRGLARMAEVRERTRIERIAMDYVEFFRHFG